MAVKKTECSNPDTNTPRQFSQKKVTWYISNYTFFSNEFPPLDAVSEKFNPDIVRIEIPESASNLKEILTRRIKGSVRILPLFFSTATRLDKEEVSARLIKELIELGGSIGTCYINPLIQGEIRANTLIKSDQIAVFPDHQSVYEHIKHKLDLQDKAYREKKNVEEGFSMYINTPSPVAKEKLIKEFHYLKAKDCLVLERMNFELYLTGFQTLKHIPFEIGRLREETFRSVGEGTGQALDLDFYDNSYKHLILYDFQNKCIVGSYRLGMGDDIYQHYGVHAFYIHSLYEIDLKAHELLAQSIELGRSFIAGPYQKKRLPLLLLWNGLMKVIVNNPRYKYLVGTVSVSKRYSRLSKSIIVSYLQRNHFNNELSIYFHPRTVFESSVSAEIMENLLQKFDGQLLNLDDFIRELEPDGHPLPVLITQYIKQNATFLGFNMDPNFSNCLDGLMLLDVQNIPKNTIKSFQLS